MDILYSIKVIRFENGTAATTNRTTKGRRRETNTISMLKKFYILYGREQESLWVPTIVVNGECLIGMEEIRNYFEHYDTDGEIRTEVPKDYE